MDHSASPSAPARRTRRIVLPGVAILGLAIAAFGVRRPLVATALDEDDGVIPGGASVSVFDEIPAVSKLDPDLLHALRWAETDAEAGGVGLRVNSGWRSPEYQRQLLRDAVVRYGSQKRAARWVATAEKSRHVSGEAVDIGPFYAAAWLSKHGAAYGLYQIYRNEPWHFELRPDAVDDGCPRMYANPAKDPRMRP